MPIQNGAVPLNNLSAPGVYVGVIPPTAQIGGVPTNVEGIVGTASWGPLNTPVLLGSPQDLQANFGPIIASPAPTGSVAAVSNYFDLVSACSASFTAASGGAIQIQAVRVGDGTQAAATLALKDTTSGTPLTGGTLTAIYTGSLGNGITATIAQAAKVNGTTLYFNVTITPPAGSGLNQEFYPNIQGAAAATSNSPFWQNLANALTSGIPGICGPSQLCSLATPSSTAENPALIAASALAGGIDGATTSAAILTAQIGSESATPQTGVWALSNASPGVATVCLAGYGQSAGDLTTNNALLQTFVDSVGCALWFDFPLGTSTSTAVTDVTTPASGGVTDYNMMAAKDWAWWNDGVSGLRFYPMAPFMAGLQASLPAWVSPLNQPIKGIAGTYRTVGSGMAPYSLAEIGKCNTNGISLVAAPSPGGSYVGVNAAVNTSMTVNPITGPCEYSTTTNFLAKSIIAAMGGTVGKNQTSSPTDPLRKQVRDALNSFFGGLVTQQGIDSFFVQCDLNNNSLAAIAAHILQASCRVRYMSSVWYLVVQLQGSTATVITSQVQV